MLDCAYRPKLDFDDRLWTSIAFGQSNLVDLHSLVLIVARYNSTCHWKNVLKRHVGLRTSYRWQLVEQPHFEYAPAGREEVQIVAR